jgi:hypothetical protein
LNYRDVKIGTNKILRHFTNFIQTDFVWHRDKEDRIITIENGDSFQLQFENELPFMLQKHNEYFIPKETYHRIVAGSGKLIIKIRKI